MSEQDSKTLTMIPASFSGGASLTAYINTWTQSPPHLLHPHDAVGMMWHTTDSTGRRFQYLSVSQYRTGVENEAMRDCSLQRMQSHVLLDWIPEPGLAKVYECLVEVLEDYFPRTPYEGPRVFHRGPIEMSQGSSYERPSLEFL